MTLSRQWSVWRYAGDLPVFRTVGGPQRIMRGDVTITGPGRVEWQTQWYPMAGVDFTDAVFDLSCFALADDMGGSVAQCPCGDDTGAADVLELLENIREHCDKKHPKALKVRWPR